MISIIYESVGIMSAHHSQHKALLLMNIHQLISCQYKLHYFNILMSKEKELAFALNNIINFNTQNTA